MTAPRVVIPICSSCKRIRDAAGVWHPGGSDLENDPNVSLTHGFCMECVLRLYGEVFAGTGESHG